MAAGVGSYPSAAVSEVGTGTLAQYCSLIQLRADVHSRLQHRAVSPILPSLPDSRLHPSPIPSLIALLVDRFLLALQATRVTHVRLSGDGTAPREPNASSGPPSLLEFVRADVDSWIQSDSISPAFSDSANVAIRDELSVRALQDSHVKGSGGGSTMSGAGTSDGTLVTKPRPLQ